MWMSGCKKEMVQYVPRGYGHKEVKARCGQTGFHGTMLLCYECQDKAEHRYPQGWVNLPGDICKHGTYVGDPGGPDFICGACEEGI